MTELAPIILFGYNRPSHMRQALENLASARGAQESPLWIFCDGNKPGADHNPVLAVRALAHSQEWQDKFASVTVVEADSNKGLARSITEGVSHVMDIAGQAIIVEDDVLVAPDFLQFMNDCLNFYKDSNSVGSVTGFSPLERIPKEYPHDVMAIPRNCSQCWATWADRWSQIDWKAQDASKVLKDHKFRQRFNSAGNDRSGRLIRQMEGKIDSWSIRFGLWHCLNAKHAIYPVNNRVRNIGYDGSGVHTRGGQDVNANMSDGTDAYRLEHVEPDPAIIKMVARKYGGPWPKRFMRSLRNLFSGYREN